MKKISLLFIYLFSSFLLAQKGEKNIVKFYEKNIRPSKELLDDWQHLDYFIDTIPGVSLDKAYTELIKDKKGKKVIVAVIDSDIDIAHEDLKNKIWINTKEIPNNQLDDDNNGYVDDMHGWNFISNKKGESLLYSLMEEARIIQKYKSQFEGKVAGKISIKDKKLFDLFSKAKASYEEILKEQNEEIQKSEEYLAKQYKITEKLKIILSDSVITLDKINAIKTSDTILLEEIKFANNFLKNKLKGLDENENLKNLQKAKEICLNLEYDNRTLVGDNPNDIKDTKYGSSFLSRDIDKLTHGTEVAGVIAADRNNSIGVRGILDNVQIMPLRIGAIGNYTDKDMALAIRYAVNNGANIINISRGKNFSLHEDWVLKAIKYASERNVLIITSAGNDNIDLDKQFSYPRDTNDLGQELVDNFINVGAINYFMTERIKRSSSNYGKINVDIFAPGTNIKVLFPHNKYNYDSGTSFAAPIVTGVAALIKSYYPNLSAIEIKNSILNSGVSFNINAKIKDSELLIPFSQLSKSGSVINAYNALLMAEQVSKAKK